MNLFKIMDFLDEIVLYSREIYVTCGCPREQVFTSCLFKIVSIGDGVRM